MCHFSTEAHRSTTIYMEIKTKNSAAVKKTIHWEWEKGPKQSHTHTHTHMYATHTQSHRCTSVGTHKNYLYTYINPLQQMYRPCITPFSNLTVKWVAIKTLFSCSRQHRFTLHWKRLHILIKNWTGAGVWSEGLGRKYLTECAVCD